MDSRTRKIRELESKLLMARDFILRCGLCAIDCTDKDTQMSPKYWAENAFRKYADTKPNDYTNY